MPKVLCFQTGPQQHTATVMCKYSVFKGALNKVARWPVFYCSFSKGRYFKIQCLKPVFRKWTDCSDGNKKN